MLFEIGEKKITTFSNVRIVSRAQTPSTKNETELNSFWEIGQSNTPPPAH